MEDREMPRMHKYGESKIIRIMMATVRYITAWAGHNKISGRLIFVERSVHQRRNLDLAEIIWVVFNNHVSSCNMKHNCTPYGYSLEEISYLGSKELWCYKLFFKYGVATS